MEMISYSLKSHLILHLSFLEIKRMSSFTFHLPLCLIHMIMRMQKNSLIFLLWWSWSICFQFRSLSLIIVVNISKPSVYDDLPHDEVETPNSIEALKPELMVMLGPHSIEVRFNSDHEIVQLPKAPHHSSLCIEDLSHRQMTLPPLKLHNPISHPSEKSYIASTRLWCKLSLFFHFLACHSQKCAYCSKLHIVSHNTIISPQTLCHANEITYVWTDSHAIIWILLLMYCICC